MIIANRDRQCKIDLEAWIQEESAAMATNILDRMPPAVRQAMKTLDAMEAGTQALMMAIGRQITETLMALPASTAVGVCRECGRPLRH